MFHYFGRSGWSNIDIRSNVWPTVGLYGVPLTLHSFGTAALPLQSLTLSKNWHPCQFLDMRGCLKSWLLFQHPREFKIKSLYSNDLILNIASKSKETVQKLKFLDSSIITAWNHGHPCPVYDWHPCQMFVCRVPSASIINDKGISKNLVRFLEMPDEFLFKSLYYNDLNKNIAN